MAPLAVLACHKLGGDNGWRLALEISIVLLTASFIFGLFMTMDDDKSTKTGQKSATDYGFLREKLFWLCTALCFFYEAVEASMMGWLTSFYIDSGVLAADAAQIITSLLWVSLLIGRFSCSVIAAKFRPWQMITVMCFGMAAFLVLLVTGTTLSVLTIATIGLGLCMSGMYGTTVANAGDLFSRYPASMGIYVTLNGFGAAMAPAAIGIAANRSGYPLGFCYPADRRRAARCLGSAQCTVFQRQTAQQGDFPRLKSTKTSLKRFERGFIFIPLPFPAPARQPALQLLRQGVSPANVKYLRRSQVCQAR